MTAAGGRGDPRRPQARPALGASTWVGVGLLAVLGVILCLPSTPGVVRVFSLLVTALLARRVSIDVRDYREDKATWAAKPVFGATGTHGRPNKPSKPRKPSRPGTPNAARKPAQRKGGRR